MANYLTLDNAGVVLNAVVANKQSDVPIPPGGSVLPAPAGIGIGYQTPDGGATWNLTATTQALRTLQTNQATIVTSLQTNQAQIQAWIQANPGGAILTAGQTLAVAKMLNDLCFLLLQQFGSTQGT